MKQHLVQQIETQLGWGEGATWSNKDFQELSDRIFSSTHKQLSVTTLKRVWGRAEMVAHPSMATLDILAEFAGYESWRQFCQRHESKSYAHTSPRAHMRYTSKPLEGYRKKIHNHYIWKGIIGLVIIGALLSLGWYGIIGEDKPVNKKLLSTSSDRIEFSFQKVATGYPNTVIFRYDIGDIPFDTLSIQQSWDQSKRISLTKPKGLITATYYYPGYFLTKLVVNDQVVREKDLYIPTQGWQGILIENQANIVYLKPAQLVQDSILRVSPDVLQQMNQHAASHLYLANLTPEPQINSSDFSMETEFRLAQPTERSICQNIRLTITGTKEVLGLQFSIPGCVGDLMFFLNKEMISGRDHDLSAFGMDFNEWVQCKIDVRNNHLFLSLNNKQVFDHKLSSDIGNIGGVQWMFEGLGEIRSLHLDDEERSLDLIN